MNYLQSVSESSIFTFLVKYIIEEKIFSFISSLQLISWKPYRMNLFIYVHCIISLKKSEKLPCLAQKKVRILEIHGPKYGPNTSEIRPKIINFPSGTLDIYSNVLHQGKYFRKCISIALNW